MFPPLQPKVKGLLVVVAAVTLLGLVATGTLARSVQPPPDATPGSVGITGLVLGGVAPIAAPDYRLEMFWMEWAPDSYVTAHTHPMSFVTCVASGALGFTLQAGMATVTRAATPDAPEQAQPNVEVILGPLDCVSVDNEATRTIHSARNASDEATIAWEADLLKTGEPPTTFVDDMGTPIPR